MGEWLKERWKDGGVIEKTMGWLKKGWRDGGMVEKRMDG